MSNPIFQSPGAPSDVSISLLTLSLRSDCETKGVSAKNYSHRSRVIRQQTELLARRRFSRPLPNTSPSPSFDPPPKRLPRSCPRCHGQ